MVLPPHGRRLRAGGGHHAAGGLPHQRGAGVSRENHRGNGQPGDRNGDA
jgi:hypothetical protein